MTLAGTAVNKLTAMTVTHLNASRARKVSLRGEFGTVDTAAGTLHPAAFGRCPHPAGIPPGPTGARGQARSSSAADAGYMAAVVAEAERLRVSVPELALGCASSWRRWARRLAGSGDE
jgi:hypothetical protein